MLLSSRQSSYCKQISTDDKRSRGGLQELGKALKLKLKSRLAKCGAIPSKWRKPFNATCQVFLLCKEQAMQLVLLSPSSPSGPRSCRRLRHHLFNKEPRIRVLLKIGASSGLLRRVSVADAHPDTISGRGWLEQCGSANASSSTKLKSA